MSWTQLTVPPPLTSDEVHVWRVDLLSLRPLVSEYRRLLAENELARAERFVFAADCESYIAARGALRILLGHYLGIGPSLVPIEVNPHGKPSVAEASNGQGLTFNLSHSGDFCLIGISLKRALGVDIEKMRGDVPFEELSARYFAPSELQDLAALEPDFREEAFWLTWTRKEAYVKARGEGLQIPLNEFAVSVDPTQGPRLVSRDSARWALLSLSPGPGFAAAMVAERPEPSVVCYDFALAASGYRLT